MRSLAIVLCAVLLYSIPSRAQAVEVGEQNSATRIAFDAGAGPTEQFGYTFTAAMFGFAVEHPFGDRFEGQLRFVYMPNLSINSQSAQSTGISGTGLFWMNGKVAAQFQAERDWLWGSGLTNAEWNPSLGAVIRDSIFRPGRLYASYVIPTGCAVAGQACASPSDRTQGLRLYQEVRIASRFRFGVRTGIYHYCNENQESVRACHAAGEALFTLRFEAFDKASGDRY
jgi:hypothetical protein